MKLLVLFSVLQINILNLLAEYEDIDAEIGLNTADIILKEGYPLEIHTVETKDGYLLQVHRIPHGRKNVTLQNKAPVLVYSGIMGDSSCYISCGPEKCLGYVLADLGYDVWLANNRGTTTCKKHVKLDPYKNKKKFWDFSFQEMAVYDVPQTIDYILNKTRNKSLYYVGHSQGTTNVFAMLADNPAYNKKIRLIIALAPITSIRHSRVPFTNMILNNLPFVKSLIERYELYELLPFRQELRKLLKYCHRNSTMQNSCILLACSAFGGSFEQSDKVYFPVILSNLPAGCSVKQLLHFSQLRHGTFQKYDYGIENIKIYNSYTPPVYNLTNVQVPTALIYGKADYISAYKDVEILARKLPNVIYQKRIKDFKHVDLVFGINAHKMVNVDIIKLLKLY